VSRGEPVEIRNLECRAGGRTRMLSVTATPLVSDDESPSGGVLVIRDETRLFELEQTLREQREIGQIVGTSEPIQRVLSTVRALAEVQTSVLITGESGTGKELVADALHAIGTRSDRPLVKVNCSALSESLLESELFGHVRGAFTGADRDKVGRFERADGGTIFLDEIGEITQRMQLGFLRVLESMEFERVGDSTPLKVDVRVIAATNRDLKARVASGDFREDLYFRLKVFEVAMPPLRARREDIPMLVRHFIDRFNIAFSKQVHGVSDAAMELFLGYDWPGNVRELENTLEHAFVLCRDRTIRRRDLPADLLASVGEGGVLEQREPLVSTLRQGEILPLDEMEKRYLEWVAATHSGDRSELASKLGLSERTFYRKMRRVREKNADGNSPDHLE
jgi:two-component system response regulator HydG